MNFFKSLAEKSWVPQAVGVDLPPANSLDILPGKTALKFFLAVVAVIFFLFTITYLSRSQYTDFQALAGKPWQPLTNPTQLWLNTGALLVASIALQWSKIALFKASLNTAIAALIVTLFFTILFLMGQVLVWQQLVDQGYFISSNPANSYYYLFTSIHGLHILGGVIALLKVTVEFISKNSMAKLFAGVSLCTTYWHFLFGVWLLLFALLTSSPETYKVIADLCGF